LPERRFDVVFHVDLMSHFIDPLEALRTMRRATRPGGVVAFEVGLLAGVSPRWYKWQRAVGYPQHRWLYTQRAIYCLLDKADLRPMATQQFGLLAETLPSALLRPVRHLLPTRKTTPIRAVTADVPAQSARGIDYLLEHLKCGLRYGAGRCVPKLGPTTAFVAARRV
jgi:hypothetical protein